MKTERWMPTLGLLMLAIAGCSDGNVTVGTSTATGTVGGIVLDANAALAPLSGATVTVIAGATTLTATTDASGSFSVVGVPAGSLVIKLVAQNHFEAFLQGTLASSAGNFPVSNAALTVGPVALVSNQGALSLRLVDDSGAPVAGVALSARATGTYVDLTAPVPGGRGVVLSHAQSGSDGVVTFAGLPDFATAGSLLSPIVSVTVPPTKVNATSMYQFLGLIVDVNALQLPSTPTLVLAGPRSALTVLASNIDGFVDSAAGPIGSLLSSSGPVTVAFNQALSPTALRAQLLTEFGAVAPIATMPSATDNLLTVTFAQPLAAGTRYNLALHVESAGDSPKVYDQVGGFFVASSTPVSVAATRFDPLNPNDVLVYFSEPIGLGSGSTAQLPCVTFYDADLDGNPDVTSPGEWNSGGNQLLKCENNGVHSGFYLRPDEPQFGASQSAPITGFTTQWRLSIKATCWNGYPCSTSGRPVHFVFSRNSDPDFLMKRPSGEAVPDLAPFTAPTY